MKLDKLDKRILMALRKNSRATLRELSREVGTSKENVHYRIKKYEKNNIITYVPYINLSKIGYDYFLVRLRANLSADAVKKELISISKNKFAVWVSSEQVLRSDDFNITIVLIGKSFSDVENYAENLRVKKHISKANVRLIRVISKSYTNFLEESEKEMIYFKVGEQRYTEKSDNLDSKIIMNLINNSRITNINLAAKIKSSQATVKVRIDKLLKEKIIDKFTIALNYDKLDGKFVRMTLEKEGSFFSKEMQELLTTYFEELIIFSLYFSQERVVFVRAKDNEKLMQAISEINKRKKVSILSVSETVKILKNKIF